MVTGLGAHTILAFSVMVGPTSASAWGGHMDPEEGVLTCGRKGREWWGGGPGNPWMGRKDWRGGEDMSKDR